MDRFAHVDFQPEEIETNRKFLLAMANVRIISLSRDEIEEIYGDLIRDKTPTSNDIVLHDQVEEDLFRHVMQVFFPEKEYDIATA